MNDNNQWTNAGRRSLAGYLAMLNDGYVTVRPASPIIHAADRCVRGVISFCSGFLGVLAAGLVLFGLSVLWSVLTR